MSWCWGKGISVICWRTTLLISMEVGPHPNQKQAFDLVGSICRAWGPDRRRLGPRQTVFLKFNTKGLCGIGMGSRFDADSHTGRRLDAPRAMRIKESLRCWTQWTQFT